MMGFSEIMAGAGWRMAVAVLALVLAVAAFVAVLCILVLRDRATPDMAETTSIAPRRSEPRSSAADLTALLQRAIDVALDDETAVALLRFRRTVLRALTSPSFDDDIAEEMDGIVERRAVDEVESYLNAIPRVPPVRLAEMEARLCVQIRFMTAQMSEAMLHQVERRVDVLPRPVPILSVVR